MPNAFYVDPVGQSGGLTLWWLDSNNLLVSFANHNLVRTVISFPHSSFQWHALFIHGSTNCHIS